VLERATEHRGGKVKRRHSFLTRQIQWLCVAIRTLRHPVQWPNIRVPRVNNFEKWLRILAGAAFRRTCMPARATPLPRGTYADSQHANRSRQRTLRNSGLAIIADHLHQQRQRPQDSTRILPALPCQLLAEVGEARGVDRPAAGLRVVDQALLQDPRNVEVDPLGAAFGVGRGSGRRGRLGGRRRGHGAGSDGFGEAPLANRRGSSGGVNGSARRGRTRYTLL
jgi:hypothetical protein